MFLTTHSLGLEPWNPFVRSSQIESVITISKMYHCLPSSVMKIDDEYTAFCFNEACCYIELRIEKGDKPHYIEYEKEIEQIEFTNFKDFYKQYER